MFGRMNCIINFHETNNAKLLDLALTCLKTKYHIIDIETLKRYFRGEIQLNRSCHITVDDGHLSFYKVFMPLLKKHKIPATLFVSPQKVCDNSNFWFQEFAFADQKVIKEIIIKRHFFSDLDIERFSLSAVMKSLKIADILSVLKEYSELTDTCFSDRLNINVGELQEIVASGLVEIGAHTISHPILFNEVDSVAAKEISESITQLERLVNRPITTFAYPNGISGCDFSVREIELLKNNNIELAFSTENELLTIDCEKYAIPRIGLYRALIGEKFMNWHLNKGRFTLNEISEQRNVLRDLLVCR